MQWHMLLAYTLMILLAMRLLWGGLGSDTARFSHFVHSPKKVVTYLVNVKQTGISSSMGHNPVGGYMVVALFLLLSVQLISGLFATDDVFTEGPLYAYVSHDVASGLTWLHKKNFDLILAFAAIHVFAVILHTIKGDSIIPAMFSGYKRLPESHVSRVNFVSVTKAILMVLVIGFLVVNYLMLPVIEQL